ncbi:endoplasmic oxidoreductin 1 [Kwoniella mangroviensis CBS 10435]|uniref:Endoplasmic oxidoreductin 1 n=1 Tax=Kwoniella mangroviensis CBS 10435 TaxID=1331196 RepID=A0A1B9J207_9TREE|nr:endoplasmic oxidoreductin 1 [Kwoniella mangroviensis CBS 10435]
MKVPFALAFVASSSTALVNGAGLTGKDSLKPESKVARNVLEGKSEGYCSPSGPIESTHCLYETVESLNKKLFPTIHELVSYPFFKHYKVDLYKECPFWHENGFCMNRNCGVEEANEDDIPEKWRAKALSEIKVSSAGDEGVSGCYFKEQDFCYVEDDADQNGQYIDLTLNPERFTGYAGDSAHNVWRAIYEENCFGLSEASLSSSSSSEKTTKIADTVLGAGGISKSNDEQVPGWGFSKLSEGWGTEMVKHPSAASAGEVELCEEKKVYYRVVSGLHASISIHICADYLDQSTGEWAPNLECFIQRLATHPERLSNVYFNAVLLLRAVARAAPYLRAYDIATAPTIGLGVKSGRESDRLSKQRFNEILDLASQGEMDKGFDEGSFFRSEDAPILKEQFKTHFRNVSRIMDCVGCDKCRLWGKLQVSGIGTALKILFELDDKALDPKINPDLLQRSEVVALFNTLHRISESLAAVEEFRQIYAAHQKEEVEGSKKKIRQIEGNANETDTTSSTSTISTILAVVLSAFEGFRRTCRGCLDRIQTEGLGQVIHRLREWVGGVGKGDL